MNVRMRDGGTRTLDKAAVDHLRRHIQGKVALPGSTDYDEARTIWNAMVDRRPAFVVRCVHAEDVAHAVRFAREYDLLTAVRAGGHNIAGSAVVDDGFVIDVSPMKRVTIDVAARTARVEAGATLAEFDTAAQAHGLATPLGVNSTTGVAGLTLGGGFGWLSRKYGMTIDNLVSANVVTADGSPVRASLTENPDLFWAIRGGGGNFGVVTSFEFRLHAVGPNVLSGLVVHPLEAAPEVLRFYREFVARAPDDFVCWCVMRKAPPLPFLAPEWHGKEVLVLAMFHAGDIAEGEKVAAPLRAFGKPIADVVGVNPYAGWQGALDPLLTPGMRNYWKSHDVLEVTDGLIDVLLDSVRRIPDPQSEIILAQLGGAVGRVPYDATAYTHRDAGFVMNVHGRWADPADDERCIGWARDLFKAAEPFATGGVYVNFMTQDEAERVQAAYAGNYARLATVKKTYDPTNFFRLNQNIRPAG